MDTTNATRLEFALLGLIGQGIQSGYELRKQFASTPMGVFSDSPGSVYPALRRLQHRGWVRPLDEGTGPRHRQAFAVTKRGGAAFKVWVTMPPSREEIVRHPENAHLRFAFMGRVAGRAAVVAFLKAFERHTTDYVRELHVFLKAMPEEDVPTGRLALENGIMQYETQARWARRALAALRRSS